VNQSPFQPDEWERIGTLFDRLSQQTPQQRHLDKLDESEAVCRLLERMLIAHDANDPHLIDQTLQSVAGEMFSTSTEQDERVDWSGRRFGPWQCDREIGRGGMALVLKGHRADGKFDKEVAIKLLPELTPAGAQRLAEEIRILARLEHPNIARLIDGDIDAEGQPYLVMELVDGQPISQYCLRHKLDLKARISLLIQVIDAVTHAHRQLVVHCDIKPANILVNTDGQVRLVDFGIAGLLSSTNRRDTSTIGWFCSPAYAAPEQLAGDPPSIQQDVFSLGAVFYELLTDTPFRNNRCATRQWFGLDRASRSPEPLLTAKRGNLGVPAADLQAILAKALADDPLRRYASADRLSEDLDHLLAGRPVSARPASAGYRLRRLVGRHRMASAGIVAATVLVVGLVAGFTLRLAIERDATRVQAEQAERARVETEQVLAFLSDIFRGGDPYGPAEPTPVAELSARQLLDRSAGTLEHALKDQPLVRARLLDEIGRIYRLLGLLDESEPLVRESLRLRSLDPQTRPLEEADTALALGRILTQRGDFDEAAPLIAHAEQVFREAGEQRRLAGALEAKGNLLLSKDDAMAIEAFEASLTLWQAHDNADREADLHLYLANALSKHDRLVEARQHREQALSLLESRVGSDHPAVAAALVGLADQYKLEHDHAAGVPLLERALEIFESHFGSDNFHVAVAANNLGTTLSDLGEQEAARPHLERALAAYRAQRPDHPNVGTILNNLGTIEWAEGRPQAAAERYREALAHLALRLREDHFMIALVESNLGEALFALGAYDDARPLLERGIEHLARRIGDSHTMLVPSLDYLASILEAQGETDRAEALLRRVLTISETEAETDQAAVAAARAALDAFLERRAGAL
jgi:eukaryotic-like serine/threonine-protein kinase